MEYEAFDIKFSLHVEIFNKSGPRIKMLILLILPFPMYDRRIKELESFTKIHQQENQECIN